MFFYAYNNASQSLNALKLNFPGARIIKKTGSTFVGGPDKPVINWGNGKDNDQVGRSNVLNRPAAVRKASNKLVFFTEALVRGVSIPEFTTDIEQAGQWVAAGNTVLARETLNGHSGEGIVILDNTVKWENYAHEQAKMYVKYIPKKDEYRLHVFRGEVIDCQRKSAIPGHTPVDWRLRNHQFGFVFTRGNVALQEGVREEALKAIDCLGLDFGAVDIIYNTHRRQPYVLEVNTAPGLEGQTLQNYSQAFADFFA